MKKFILSILMVFGAGMIFAQTCTLRLEMPATPPNPGEDFYVGIMLDELDYPGYTFGNPTFKSAQIGIVYDPAVVTPLQTVPPPPPPKWFHNLNQMFTDYAATPAAALPAPGDLRFVFYTTFAPGMDPSFYGFSSGNPIKLWDLKFNYIGGYSTIEFGDVTTTKMTESPEGNKYEIKELKTIVTAWDDAIYGLTSVNTEIGGGVGTPGLWTGAADDGDWFNPGNWDDGNVPADGDNIEIPVLGKAMYPTISGGLVTTGTMMVASGASLTLAADGELTTNGLFTCDGDFMIMTEDLNGYSGTFIDNGGLAGGGMFYFTRNMFCTGSNPALSEDPLGWHYLSAPIDGFTTDDMMDYFVNQWDETAQMWTNFAGMEPCIPFAPAESLDAMEAWSINWDSQWPTYGCPMPGTGYDLEFMGPFTAMHSGPYSAPATVSAGTFAGWNTFGNPYPSGLDLDGLTWDAGAVQGAAFYDGCAGNYVYYSSAVPGVNSVIAPGLGFFVEYTAAGTFDVSNADRAHGADWFWKEDISNLLTIQASGVEYTDVTHIRFMEEAEAGFAKDGDFHKLISTTEGLPQIYTTAGADMLAINALPQTNVVPMGFTASTSGSYTIEAIETSEFSEVNLVDLVTGEVTDLLSDSYSFEYTTGDDANRFEIHFAPVGTPEFDANSVKIWSNNNNIYVNVPKTLQGTISVFNMMGQEVVSTDTEPGMNVIPMYEVNTYYVVKVLSNDNAITGKVYIK